MVGGVETAPCTMMYTCVEQYVVSGVHTALCISTVCTLCRVWSNWWSGQCGAIIVSHHKYTVYSAQCVEWTVNYARVHYAGCTVWSNMLLLEWTVWSNVQCEHSTLCRVHSVEQYVVGGVETLNVRTAAAAASVRCIQQYPTIITIIVISMIIIVLNVFSSIIMISRINIHIIRISMIISPIMMKPKMKWQKCLFSARPPFFSCIFCSALWTDFFRQGCLTLPMVHDQ